MTRMDDFETHVRETVREVGRHADPADDLSARLIANAQAGREVVSTIRRARTSWLLPLAAAAIVLVIAGTLAVVSVTTDSHHRGPSTGTPAATTSVTPSVTPTKSATLKKLVVTVGTSMVRLSVPVGWHESRTQPKACCNVPPTVCLVTGTADYAGNEMNCVLTVTAGKGPGVSPDYPRPTPTAHCAKWSTTQQSELSISGRPGEFRRFHDGCTGADAELWTVMNAPQILYWHRLTAQSSHDTVAAVVATAVLPPVSDPRRQFDTGYIRSITHKADGYHFAIDRVTVGLDGKVINSDPTTFDYLVSSLGQTGGTAPCGVVNDTSTSCDLARVLAQFDKGLHPNDGTVAVDGAFVEVSADGPAYDVLFTLPQRLS